MKHFLKKLVVGIITWEARTVLKKYKPKIVAVTGSVGKTSAKDAIFAVLAKRSHVRKSEKSFNSEIGLPLEGAARYADDNVARFKARCVGRTFRRHAHYHQITAHFL